MHLVMNSIGYASYLKERNMRLDKFLADMQVGTRSDIKKVIRKSGVTVNGDVIRDPGYQLEDGALESLTVTYMGTRVQYETQVYYMMNKPAGVLSASEDKRQTTVVDLIKNSEEQTRADLFPVGRLDKDTEGLLLITNDGQMAHRLLVPRFHIDKVYAAHVSGIITEGDAARFERGIQYDEHLTALPARLEIVSVNDNGTSDILVTIREGKFHQIKKMVAALGEDHEVLHLRRLSMGPIALDPTLAPGEFRRLTDRELELLKQLISD